MKKNLNLLFLPKLLPRADIIGGPVLIYHRIKNLSSMGHKITLIAPSYTDADRKIRALSLSVSRLSGLIRSGNDHRVK